MSQSSEVQDLLPEDEHSTEHKHGGLTELPATAICGNDITSSCLYVSALAIVYAGRWAPVSLLIVAAVLFLFRSIYAEVVGALPLNGGAYNALLNTTSKFRASIAACLTILSYMATAVISASEAMHYAHHLWDALWVIPATICLLALFMVLAIVGISESARVAVGIFIFHLVSLTLLVVVGVIFVAGNGVETLVTNLSTPYSGVLESKDTKSTDTELTDAKSTDTELTDAKSTDAGSTDTDTKSKDAKGGLMTALFFGFAAALLGISGFESSSNFVEEQAEGVFPKTLRNMWIAVSVFNPTMALLALALVPLADVPEHKEALLAHMGAESGGKWLSWLISVDAVLVLSGAVLTSYVGVNGLMRRMTFDRCLPQFFLKSNSRGTTHRIIIGFFLLCVSVLLITWGDLKALAGVYTISFLAVMVLFGIGNVLLKVKRDKLPRPSRASWPAVLFAIAAVVIGLVGNAVMNPPYLFVFLQYFIPAVLIVSVMLGRIAILKATLFVIRTTIATLIGPMHAMADSVRNWIERINSQQIVFFTRGDDVAKLNTAMLYVRENENTNRIKVVTVLREGQAEPPRMRKDLEFLDEAYPEIDVEFVVINGRFGPELIQELSDRWKIPKNLMFIGSPGTHFIYGLAELGGVRLII